MPVSLVFGKRGVRKYFKRGYTRKKRRLTPFPSPVEEFAFSVFGVLELSHLSHLAVLANKRVHLECHASITAVQSQSRLKPVSTAESFDLEVNADCIHSDCRQVRWESKVVSC